MDYKSCLKDIIGITRSECACIKPLVQDSSLPENWYMTSTSGLYLDELEGLISLFALEENRECDTVGLSKFFVTARDNAIKALYDDYLIALNQKFKEGYRTYNGVIGNKHIIGSQELNYQYVGVKMHTVPMKGGLITINNVYAMMDADATFNIYVYKVERNSLYFELVTTIPDVVSKANQIHTNTLDTPVELPLSEFGCDYYFLYIPSGFNPKQNNVLCGCGNVEYILRMYMQVIGVYGDDVAMMPYFYGSSYAQGLAFDAIVGCNAGSMLCNTYNLSTPSQAAMAYAVRYKAGELVHEYVLRSNNINQYTMSSREYLWGKRSHFKTEYMNIINWLVDNADMDMIDCYVCNDKRVTKNGILA